MQAIIEVDDTKAISVQAIYLFLPQKTAKEVSRVLDMTGWYQRFIYGYVYIK